MRRNDREIRDRQTMLDLLNRCHIGRLATNGHDGYPRIKPVNFIHLTDRIYFHTAHEGEKIEDIKRDPKVWFEVDQPIAHVMSGAKPCSAGYLYRSVMIRGRASLVTGVAEKTEVLDGLMQKHEGTSKKYQYSDAALSETGIVRIDIEEMTGKESLGQGKVRAAAEEALRTGQPLPVVIVPDK